MTTIAPPADLTLPEPGSTTLRDVLSAALRRLLQEVVALRPRDEGDADLLKALVHDRRGDGAKLGPLVAALRRPTVGTLARCLRSCQPSDEQRLLRQLLAEIAVELGAMGALDQPVVVRHPPARWLSLAGRFGVRTPEGAGAAAVSGEGIRFENATAPIDLRFADAPRAFHEIAGPVVLALEDDNPLSLVELHPDKSGNAVDLGGRPVEEWTRSVREALALVRDFLPDLHREIELVLHQVIPVGFEPERQLSASYQEAIGTVYVSLHPRPMVMAEALIHEVSHNKLNALFEIDPVLDNAFSSLHASPVRPDPRPLHGVLLAVHAFLPVERLYDRMIAAAHPLANAAFRGRHEAIRQKNREGAEVVLGEGRPTDVGRGLLGEIARLTASSGGS